MTCKLQNFIPRPNDFKDKACDHLYKLLFTLGTLLREVDSSKVPHDDFKFKESGDILNGKFRSDLLVGMILDLFLNYNFYN